MAQQHQVANTETWNGTSWTEVNDLNTSMQQLAGDGTAAGSAGTQTSALAFGGNPGQAVEEGMDHLGLQ